MQPVKIMPFKRMLILSMRGFAEVLEDTHEPVTAQRLVKYHLPMFGQIVSNESLQDFLIVEVVQDRSSDNHIEAPLNRFRYIKYSIFELTWYFLLFSSSNKSP